MCKKESKVPTVITTNYHIREFIFRDEIPSNIQADEFDWCDSIGGYFKFKGYYYHVSQFMRTDLPEWDGIYNDSFFSGVLIRLEEDGHYRVATYQHMSG
tara:strand:+ start:570 stop:866 length:297 start_codon:yes stop_codon:yes gene_type:complete